jgi:hypothetical protein
MTTGIIIAAIVIVLALVAAVGFGLHLSSRSNS